MRKFLIYLVVGILLLILLSSRLAPRQSVDLGAITNPAGNLQIADIDAYLQAAEERVANIKPNQHKRVIWAQGAGVKTDRAIVYLHGFSASSGELSPVPEELAGDLGANLYFTRLAGHGIDDVEAMGRARVQDWLGDLKEALAIGRLIGDEVTVIGTSTGGTLLALALQDADLAMAIDQTIFISPNFAVQNPSARLVSWPYFAKWGPHVAGEFREWQPVSELQARFWSTRYRTIAVIPMMALVGAVEPDLAKVKPSLFIVDRADQVVKPEASLEIAKEWGADVVELALGPDDDPYHHVLAGDALSPGQNVAMIERLREWITAH